MAVSTRSTSRRRAIRGVDRRLADTLRHCGVLAPTPVRAPAPTLPPAALPPDPAPGRTRAPRIERGMYLQSIPVDAPPVFEVIGEVWRHAGYDLIDTSGPDGRLLVAHDRQGYTLALHQYRGVPLLLAASPPIGRGPRAVTGWCVGFVAGVVGAFVPFADRLPDGPVARRAAGLVHAVTSLRPLRGVTHRLDWLPVLAVAGLAAVLGATWRRFGVGLLLGAVSSAVVVGVVCAVLAR